jgi:hypothetical protein
MSCCLKSLSSRKSLILLYIYFLRSIDKCFNLCHNNTMTRIETLENASNLSTEELKNET